MTRSGMGFAASIHIVMAGHSRSKNGVASLAYVPAIHDFAVTQAWMPGTRPGMTGRRRSPDGAERNPGPPSPYSAPLHTGYQPDLRGGRYTSLTFFSGRLRTGRPVAAWMALSTAGAVTQMVGSPTPPQKS